MEVYLSAGNQTKKIGADDDGAGGTDSRLVIAVPQEGQYFIGVSSVDPGESGRYTLSLELGGSRQAATPPPSRVGGGSADRWLPASETDIFVVDVDRTRIVPQGNNVYRAWVRHSYTSPETDPDGDTYDLTITQRDYDCVKRLGRFVSVVQYLGSRVVYSTPSGVSLGSWVDWVPDSSGEAIGEMVCELARRR
jgi:hypothetical protein